MIKFKTFKFCLNHPVSVYMRVKSVSPFSDISSGLNLFDMEGGV